jgi:glycosyltransferase involved in cell wall biosynthesis
MEKKIKIGFIDYVLEPDKPGRTGLSDIVWELGVELVAQGNEVHVIASYQSTEYPNDLIIVHNFSTPPIGYRNLLGQLWILKRAANIIRHLSLDIIHSPEYVSTSFMWILGIRTPMVLTVPGNIYERIQNGNPFDYFTTQVLKIAARVSAVSCNQIIATSNEMARWWSKTGASASRMSTIPLGVDTHLFHSIPNARTLLEISPQKRLILFVGRLSREKGLKYLVKAFSNLCVGSNDLELHLIGEGGYGEHLHDSSVELGIERNIVFHGKINRNELPIYYSAADITVLPSLSEGLPRTMLESLACGSPFLGTKITGIEDHIRDSETGFLVEPGNTEMLTRKLDAVLRDRELAMTVAKRGQAYVRNNLTWEVIAKRIQNEVYSKILN